MRIIKTNKYFLALLLCLLSITGCSLLRTDYEFSHYDIKGCSNKLTTVIYSGFNKRGVIFINGEHHTKNFSGKDYIEQPELSGFDASFECVVTCENGVIIVNHYEGYFIQKNPGRTIISRRLHQEDYGWLRNSNPDNIIKIY